MVWAVVEEATAVRTRGVEILMLMFCAGVFFEWCVGAECQMDEDLSAF